MLETLTIGKSSRIYNKLVANFEPCNNISQNWVFDFLNKIIVFFVDSQVQKSVFGLFNQCLYSYQNKGPCGARVQNHSTATRGYLKNLQKAILLGLG